MGKPQLVMLVGIAVSMAILTPPSLQAQVRSQSRIVPKSQPHQLPTDYYLAGGDLIRIYIIEAPEYSGEYLIPPDGKLYLPLIGSVSVLGLTQEQAQEAIAAKYARYLKR